MASAEISPQSWACRCGDSAGFLGWESDFGLKKNDFGHPQKWDFTEEPDGFLILFDTFWWIFDVWFGFKVVASNPIGRNPTNLRGLRPQKPGVRTAQAPLPKYPNARTHFTRLWLFGTENHHGLVGNGMQWVSIEISSGMWRPRLCKPLKFGVGLRKTAAFDHGNSMMAPFAQHFRVSSEFGVKWVRHTAGCWPVLVLPLLTVTRAWPC